MLRQLVTFVVDKVVEEDLRLLLANALGSITLPDGTTRLLGPVARDAFAIFEDLYLNGEHPQYLRLEYLHMKISVGRTHELSQVFCMARVSFSSYQYYIILPSFLNIMSSCSYHNTISPLPLRTNAF